jgi:putative acetyltransferase
LTLHIRAELPRDREEVRKVNEEAFGQADEADLVDRLREEQVILLSLVAETDDRIAGHILFTRMFIETDQGPLEAVALAPVAVRPVDQRRQIGSSLIRRGLAELQKTGERIVIVLGHPAYYTRFGFSTEKVRDVASPFPPEAFMGLELSEGALDGVRGAVRYPAAFGLD